MKRTFIEEAEAYFAYSLRLRSSHSSCLAENEDEFFFIQV